MAPLLLPWQPGAGGAARRPGPAAAAPAAQPRLAWENDAALTPTPFPLLQYDFIKNLGPVWSFF
jgi:hypothetical protein